MTDLAWWQWATAAVPVPLTGLLIALGIACVTWIVSVPLHDASLADRVWPSFITMPALFYWWFLGGDPRATFMLAITCGWAVRLTLHIMVRNWGHGEDRRYQAIRERNQPGFGLKSLWLVFLLQAVLGWVVGWPMLAASGAGQRPWGIADSLGATLAVAGLLVESIADAQLARFLHAPEHRDRVLDTGLWRYSRHPNYFGECCLWWGLGLMGLSASGWGGWWCLGAPLLMTILLLRVSGVTLLERDIGERRPAYRDYIARTSAFVLWPSRQGTDR